MFRTTRFPALLAGLLLFLLAAPLAAQPPPDPGDPFGEDPFGNRFGEPDADVDALVRTAFFSRNSAQRTRALRFLVERDQKDVIPAFIAVLRLLPDEDGRLLDALQRLARANIPRDWKAWTEWQEDHTEIRPYRGFVSFKADILAGIDPNFRDFLYTLCGSGILFDTRVPGRREPFVFGSSGLLYRSNKLMYDTETESLWNQFTGEPVVGELTESEIVLKVLPVVITSWNDWLTAHPHTTVLSLDTGFDRDYRPGRPYGQYFASPELMFPVVVRDRRLDPKDRIFVLRDGKAEMAWALSLFDGAAALHDRVGTRDVVLIGDAEFETVRAYDSGGRTFTVVADDPAHVESGGTLWSVSEDALTGPDGETLPRLPGHMAYWFAYQSYHPGKPVRTE